MTSQPACADAGAGAGAENFFLRDDEPTEPTPARFINAARTYCANCPIRPTCGQQFKNKLGLWGGIYYYYKNYPRKSRVYKTINLLAD